MSPKTGCGNIRAQPDGIFGGHSGGQLEPRAPVNIALWPWPATCGDTSVPLPDPLSPPLPSVPLAEAQGSLLSALPSFGSSLVFPGSSDGKESACNTGDPGSIWGACGLQSMGSQRVRHHWSDLAHMQYSTACRYMPLFIHSSVTGHPGARFLFCFLLSSD